HRRDPLRVGYAVLAAPEPAVEEHVVLRHGVDVRVRDRDRAPDLHDRDRAAGGGVIRDRADVVIIGAGVSGLGYANWWRAHHPEQRVIVLEGDAEVGGYCKTIVQDGFVWD